MRRSRPQPRDRADRDLRLGRSRVRRTAAEGNSPVAAMSNRRAGRPGSVAMRGQRISKVFEQDKGLRRFTGNSAPGRAESSATLKLSYSAVLVCRWPSSRSCSARRPHGQRIVRSSIQRGARPDRVTREFGCRAACLQAVRTPRVPSGLESAMIPRGVAASLERTGGEAFAVNMQRIRDMRSERRMRACEILSVDGPSREKSGQGLDRRFRGRPAASRACSLHSCLRRPLTPPPAPRSSASMAGKLNFPALQVDADSVRRAGFTRVVLSRHTHRASGKRRCAHRGGRWRTR